MALSLPHYVEYVYIYNMGKLAYHGSAHGADLNLNNNNGDICFCGQCSKLSFSC
jgi:hypothetical protein